MLEVADEVRIEPFSGTIEDHPGVDEAVKMICQVLSWWRFKCSVLGYWGRQGDYRVEWNCRNLEFLAVLAPLSTNTLLTSKNKRILNIE